MKSNNSFSHRKKRWLGISVGFLCWLCVGIADDRLDKVASGKGKIIDLTYSLNSKTPYWPGEKYFPFKFETIATLAHDGVFSGKLTMPEHIGTHLDAPNHFVAGQRAIHEIPMAQLFGAAIVINVVSVVEKNPDYRLSLDDIKNWEKTNGGMPSDVIVFLYTGWGKFWNDFNKYKNQDAKGDLHFPGYSSEAAEFLVRAKNIKGLGIDTLSVDYGLSKDFIVHHISHKAGKYHLENVANLDKLPPKGAFVIVAPIKVEGGSGGPTRVFALLE